VFISFEGIDGSGKSTQARLLANALRQQGQEVVEVREPGGTELGESIRRLLLNPETHISPRAELLLFSAARAELVETVIRPALDASTVVIADRYTDSSTAYQGAGRGLQSASWFEEHHRFVTAELFPYRTYLIDVSLETAASRRNRRRPDRMETGDADFYHRIIEGYHELMRRHPERVRRVDGSLPPSEIHRQILADLQSRS
jgi:dTMP kinase